MTCLGNLLIKVLLLRLMLDFKGLYIDIIVDNEQCTMINDKMNTIAIHKTVDC